MDEIERLSGQVVESMTSAEVSPDPKARIGITGPIDGKVITSASTMLRYREPSITVIADLESGRTMDAYAEARTLISYIPDIVRVVGRRYRIWIPDRLRRDDPREAYDRVLETLIDADPRESWRCIERSE